MESKLPKGQFSGTILKSIEAAGAILAESFYQPNFKLGKHSHENACFCFVLEGSFNEIYGRKQRVCNSSTLLFRPSDESHFDYFQNEGARCFNIEIETHLLERLNDYSKLKNESIVLGDNYSTLLALNLYREFRWMDEVSGLAIEGLLLEMLAGLSRHLVQETKPQPPRWLENVKERLHEEFAENLTLAELSESAGIHPVHLAREFRRFYRCTVGEYMRGLRVEFARLQISKTDLPLSRIALDAGFSHQSHFSNAFKRYTGLTPAQYRSLFHSR